MPDVRDVADAIAIAFDDLRALTQPGDAGSEGAALQGLVSKAGKRLAGGIADAVTGAVTGAVTHAARSAVGTAMDAAVAQVTGRGRSSPRAGAPIKPRRGG
jgi:hypothetical protein